MLKKNEQPILSVEFLSRSSRFRETIIMGLRMLCGVRIAEMKERFGLTPDEYYGEKLTELENRNLLETQNGFLRLTPVALPVANQVLAQLV